MDKLLEATQYYSDNLEGKKFLLRAGKKGQVLELKIFFGAEHFKHLMGLHKLKDLPVIQKSSSEILYKRILNNQITLADISKSEYFSEMSDRLGSFHQIKDTMFSPGLMLKSSDGTFKSISADFLLAKKNDTDEYVHLFLKNSHEGITVPVTFFERQDYEYFRLNSGRWTVLSVEEVKKTAHQDQKPQSNSQTRNGAGNAQEQQQQTKQNPNEGSEKLDKNNDVGLDLVAATMEQCGNKIAEEIVQATQAKNTQKEATLQQVGQVQQSQQARQGGQVRQVVQVKQKSKSDKGSSGKR